MRLQRASFLKAREVKTPSLRERATFKNQRATGCTSLFDPRSPACLPGCTAPATLTFLSSLNAPERHVLSCMTSLHLFLVKFFSLRKSYISLILAQTER